MSRLIKQYPYMPIYQEVANVFANNIEQLTLLGVEFPVIQDGTIYKMRAHTAIKAFEDRKGVFISFNTFEVFKESWVLEKKIKTKLYCCDEEKFCDAVYDAVSCLREVATDSRLLEFRNAAALVLIPPAIQKEGYEVWYP